MSYLFISVKEHELTLTDNGQLHFY